MPAAPGAVKVIAARPVPLEDEISPAEGETLHTTPARSFVVAVSRIVCPVTNAARAGETASEIDAGSALGRGVVPAVLAAGRLPQAASAAASATAGSERKADSKQALCSFIGNAPRRNSSCRAGARRSGQAPARTVPAGRYPAGNGRGRISAMTTRSGFADLPLHGGHVPAWLAMRMAALGRVIAEAIVHHYGPDELLRRLSHPFWFQSFGSVMGMDWHSSGITTSVLGALKRGLAPVQGELGIYVCGGRGRASRRTPEELMRVGEITGIDAA